MQAILFALISYLGWGTGDIFGTIATRKIGGYSTTLYYLVFQLLIFIPFALFFTSDLKNLTFNIILVNLLLGIIGTVGLIAFYQGLKIANASLVGTISSSFAALTVVFSIIFLKESVSLAQAFSIALIFIGIVISGLDFKELQVKKLVINKGVLLAFVAMITWGIYWAFIKIPIREIGWYWPGIISMSTFPVILLFMKFNNLRLEKPTFKDAMIPLIVNSALVGAGSLSFNFAISKGLVAIVAPIAGAYPTLFATLAFLVFKDPITRQQIFGIVTTLIGIVLLSIFSV